MKVLVSYGCDLEDIPRTVTELLGNLKENDISLVEIDLQDAILYSNENNIGEALEAIDKARIQLAKIDNRLMDYASILAGYSKTNTDILMGINQVEEPNQLDGLLQENLESEVVNDVQVEQETDD